MPTRSLTSFAAACGVSAPCASSAATSVAAQPDPVRCDAGSVEHRTGAGPAEWVFSNVSRSTLFSADAFAVALNVSTAGTSTPTIVPRNTARTRPRTARNAALGLSASRRVASSGQGPATTIPIMTISSPG